MQVHYFNQDSADGDDTFLAMAKGQGYVPVTCLLGGCVVMSQVTKGNDPCTGCECDRAKCKGRNPKERYNAP